MPHSAIFQVLVYLDGQFSWWRKHEIKSLVVIGVDCTVDICSFRHRYIINVC
jgi:hypothetical protein